MQENGPSGYEQRDRKHPTPGVMFGEFHGGGDESVSWGEKGCHGETVHKPEAGQRSSRQHCMPKSHWLQIEEARTQAACQESISKGMEAVDNAQRHQGPGRRLCLLFSRGWEAHTCGEQSGRGKEQSNPEAESWQR